MQLCKYLCFYLPQAVSLPAPLGIEWDFFLHNNPVQQVKLEPAVVTCSVAVPLVPAVSLQFWPVRRAKTGPFLGLIARDRLQLPSELGLECRNPAHQAVSPSLVYL